MYLSEPKVVVMKIIQLSIISCLILIVSSCKKDEEITATNTEAEFIEELRNSSSSLEIESRTYNLNAFVWRDFMPSPEPNGTKMQGQFRLTSDVMPFPMPDYKFKRCYLINNNQLWNFEFPPKTGINGSFDNGPQWETGIAILVVCELEYEKRLYRLKRTAVITRTN